MLHGTEIPNHDGANQHLENDEEFALLDEVRLASLENQFGDFAHRLMNRQVLHLIHHDVAEQHAESRDDQANQQQVMSVLAAVARRIGEEFYFAEVWKDEVRFAASLVGFFSGASE